MKQLILIGLLLVSMMSGLRAEGPPSPPRPPEVKEEIKEEPRISTGERIEIPDVGFTIIPPNGWMVHKNSHGSSLLFEAPKQPNQIYQPTIQVMVFSKHRYIDEVTMKEYGDLIVEKFGKMSNRVSGYRLRDAAIQRLETGDPSILYYTEFQYDDVAIMQMHILISSATNHFVMTYTDIAKIFEDESSPGLAIAYTSMHSAQLATRPPWRWRGFAIAGGVALMLIVGWFSMRFMRARRLARLGQRIEDEDSKEITQDEESHYYSRHSRMTQAESHVGDDEWAASKPQSKAAAAKVSQIQSSHFDEDDEPEVSEVVPISTLEKSLHPGRKRRAETVATTPRQPTPPMPPTSQNQPISNHQAMQHPAMPQQTYAQQPMAPQGMPQVQQPMAPQSQPMMPTQGIPQQPLPPHGMQPPMNQPQQPWPQQGMQPAQQQPLSQPPQPLPPHGMQPPMNQPQQPMPQHGMQPPMNPPQTAGSYPQGMPQDQQPVSQNPFLTQMPNVQGSMQPPVTPPQAFAQEPIAQPHPMPQQSQPAPVPVQNPFQAQPVPEPAMQPAPFSQPIPQPQAMPVAPQFAQGQTLQGGFVPNVQPQSHAPNSEQPAYVQQAYAPAAQAAPMQAHSAAAPTPVPAPAPVAQTFAAPAQPAAPVMPQMAPAAEPMSEPPITASRKTQSQINRKQPLSQDNDDEPEMTEEARLSEILPKAGTIEKSKPKRKGLFWRKKTDDDDDQDEGNDEKASWNMPAAKKSKGKEDDDELDAKDQWAVTPSEDGDAALTEKDNDEPAESEAWAPEATKRSEPRKDSLLNETQGPQNLVRRAPQGPVTKGNNAAVTEDGWNLNQEVASDHDEEDEEEVG
jgi:hypothetical protein